MAIGRGSSAGEALARRIAGEVWKRAIQRQVKTQIGDVCKTVGSAYPGSNPGPATQKPRSEPVTRNCVTGSCAERERSVTPPAVPVQRVRPRSWQVSGPAGSVPRGRTADSRRIRGEVHRAAAGRFPGAGARQHTAGKSWPPRLVMTEGTALRLSRSTAWGIGTGSFQQASGRHVVGASNRGVRLCRQTGP